MRTAWHAMVGVALSGQRRFVPRASTSVNYKIVPAGTRDGGAARVANTLRRAWKAAVSSGQVIARGG
jgi:hypothetical protein